MNSASMVTSDQKSGPVVPGTNKYTMEGSEDITINQPYKLKQILIYFWPCVLFAHRANPVLNLNIDTAMVLDLNEENSDVDKVR